MIKIIILSTLLNYDADSCRLSVLQNIDTIFDAYFLLYLNYSDSTVNNNKNDIYCGIVISDKKIFKKALRSSINFSKPTRYPFIKNLLTIGKQYLLPISPLNYYHLLSNNDMCFVDSVYTKSIDLIPQVDYSDLTFKADEISEKGQYGKYIYVKKIRVKGYIIDFKNHLDYVRFNQLGTNISSDRFLISPKPFYAEFNHVIKQRKLFLPYYININ